MNCVVKDYQVNVNMIMGPGVSPTGDLMWDQNQTRQKVNALITGV
jgi:hypothetical protein